MTSRPADRTDLPPGRTLYAGALVLGTAAVLGWLLAISLVHWPMVTRLWLEASEQRFLGTSAAAEPATWVVVTDDIAALHREALLLDDVLGIEVHRMPDEAAIAFASADSASVARVAALPMVRDMQRRRIAMICH